jgi:hypothetical protein
VREVASANGAPSRTKPHGCVDQACREEPRATKSRESERTLVATTARAGLKKIPGSDPWGKPGEEGCAIAGREVGARGAHALIDGRRLGPGKATSCHDDGVEAVLAALAESVKKQRATAKRARTGIERRSRQGCQRYDRRRARVEETRPHVARPIRRSDAERRETLSSPVSMGGNPTSHAQRRAGDAEPGADGVRVLVVELWEAETRSDASLISLHGESQDDSRERDLARKKPSRRQRRPRD